MQSNQARIDSAHADIIQGHWIDAEETVRDLRDDSSEARQITRLCRNMMAAQQFQPTLYATLFEAVQQGNMGRTARPTNAKEWRTVAVRGNDQRFHLLHPRENPIEKAKKLISERMELFEADRPLIVTGMSDGHLLNEAANRMNKFPGGRQLPVYAIEPDPDVVLANFHIHTWWKNDGKSPLTNTGFMWFVGKNWDYKLKTALDKDVMLLPPKVEISHNQEVSEEAKKVVKQMLVRTEERTKATVRKRSGDAEIISNRATARVLVEPATKQVPPPTCPSDWQPFCPWRYSNGGSHA